MFFILLNSLNFPLQNRKTQQLDKCKGITIKIKLNEQQHKKIMIKEKSSFKNNLTKKKKIIDD